ANALASHPFSSS
ncbi:hypothetical protein D046_8460B, partial [Vibrio parahaemolyticus V-223/04]